MQRRNSGRLFYVRYVCCPSRLVGCLLRLIAQDNSIRDKEKCAQMIHRACVALPWLTGKWALGCLARTRVKAPQRGHLNSITSARPLASSFPQRQHLISSSSFFCMTCNIVAPHATACYRACALRGANSRRILCGWWCVFPSVGPWSGCPQPGRWGRVQSPPPLPNADQTA